VPSGHGPLSLSIEASRLVIALAGVLLCSVKKKKTGRNGEGLLEFFTRRMLLICK